MGLIFNTVHELSSNERTTTELEISRQEKRYLFAREKNPNGVSDPGPLGEKSERYLCYADPSSIWNIVLIFFLSYLD